MSVNDVRALANRCVPEAFSLRRFLQPQDGVSDMAFLYDTQRRRHAHTYSRASRNDKAAPLVAGTTRDSKSLAATLQLMGVVRWYLRDSEVVGENEPAEYFYKVISGGVRSSKIHRDGRRQIRAFYFPGDIFDLELADAHTCSAEAITHTKVLVVKRKAIMECAVGDAAVAQELFDLAAHDLRRVQERIPLLVKSAEERVASFLLEMAERGLADDIIELPMSRQDIADYLGLTIGSISRTLRSLETCAAIEVRGRRIVLCNRSALKSMHG